MDADFDWNDIPVILALARGGSIAAAARALGIDASTVGRRLSAAERRLGSRLFARDRDGLRLTEAGAAFVARGASVAEQVNGMLLAADGARAVMEGVVRIGAIDFLVDWWLLPHLSQLGARYPGLQVELMGSNDNVSFARREADLALRLGRPVDEPAVAMRKLGKLGWAVYGAPAFAGAGRQQWPAMPWIAYHDNLAHLPEMRWLAREQPDARRSLRTDSLNTMAAACRAGLGLALLPCLLDGAPGLVRLDGRIEVVRELWLLRHREAVATQRIGAVADWLAGLGEDTRDRLRA